MTSAFGVYVHFPYCRKRCPYCDFAVAARKTIPHQRYQRQVLAELGDRAALFPGRRAVSVYFGGGTPSLWEPACIAAVTAAVLAAFPPKALTPPVTPEVTLEADPTDLDAPRLAAFREAGVNRLSLGVQSLNDDRLRQLGRQHSAASARAAVAAARAAGFANVSVDLMIGLPDQSAAELATELDGLLALAPEHLSLYQLTVEPRTAFAAASARGALVLPDDGQQAERYQQVRDTLEAAGFQHYEISNFARPGSRAVHNQLYWTGGEYLANRRGVDDYLGGRGLIALNHHSPPGAVPPAGAGLYEVLPADALAREALWLGLRFLPGVSRAAFQARHGQDPAAYPACDPLRRRGLLALDGDRLYLTRQGVLFADEVGAALL